MTMARGVCDWCGTHFTPRTASHRFCSKTCAGRHQWRNHTPRIHRWGKRPPLDAEHRKLRRQLLPAAIGLPCPLGCGRIMNTTAQLDHIIPRAQGGPTTRANCRIICAPCNGRRGAVDGGKAAQAKARSAQHARTTRATGRSNHW